MQKTMPKNQTKMEQGARNQMENNHFQSDVTVDQSQNIVNKYKTIYQQASVKPLSAEALAHFLKTQQAKLKSQYQKHHTIEQLFGKPLAIGEACINITEVVERSEKKEKKDKEDKEDKEEQAENKEEKVVDGRLSSYEALSGDKRPLTVQNLFKSDEKTGKKPHRLLIQGRAGIGKTTLTTYLSHQWATEKLWSGEFTWVFKITLEYVNSSV